MNQRNKPSQDERPADIGNCQVRRRRLGIAECMTATSCQWAERTFGKVKLCKHPSVKQIAAYREPA